MSPLVTKAKREIGLVTFTMRVEHTSSQEKALCQAIYVLLLIELS